MAPLHFHFQGPISHQARAVLRTDLICLFFNKPAGLMLNQAFVSIGLKGSCTLEKFEHENGSIIATIQVCDCDPSLLTLATLGDIAQIEVILFILPFPSWPRQVSIDIREYIDCSLARPACLPALFWLSSYVADHCLAVVPQAGAEQIF